MANSEAMDANRSDTASAAGDAPDASPDGRPDDAPPAPVADMLDRIDGGDAGRGPDAAVHDGTVQPSGTDDETPDQRAPDSSRPDDATAPSVPTPDGDGEQGRSASLPDEVSSWLATVEHRVEHGERLTDASVVEAAAVVDDRGGVDAVAALPDRLAADERTLRELADRVDDLADRAAATDVPVGALRRLS
jgi:hypothetical protein